MALGHTGGTLDKLESIPGYTTRLGLERLQEVVADVGCAIVGQTAELAPADGRLYAIRDVTATVDIQPLIVASILSKKLAAGLDGLVMDVKVGSGAFLPSIEAARGLAKELVDVAEGAGLPCCALLTDMGQCLGWTAGNALEVREAIDCLTGEETSARLKDVTLALAAELARQGGLADGYDQAISVLENALDNGRAAERFQKMVHAQGGPADLIDHPNRYLPEAPVQRPISLEGEGIIEAIDGRKIGLEIIGLGGGRQRPDDRIDPSVGLSAVLGIGDVIEKGRPFAIVHAADEAAAGHAIDQVKSAVSLTTTPLSSTPKPVIERI